MKVFTNCSVLRLGRLVDEDLWVQDGKVVSSNQEGKEQVEQVDCGGAILAPGFIDLQINGAFGLDFTSAIRDEEQG